MLSTSQSILFETFPPEELGLANGLFGLGVVVGPTVGPTLGGWIIDSYSWRWIFYINLPIGVVAILMAMAFLPESREARKIDSRGLGGDRPADPRHRLVADRPRARRVRGLVLHPLHHGADRGRRDRPGRRSSGGS